MGGPLKTYRKAVRKELLDLEVISGLWQDRVAWRASPILTMSAMSHDDDDQSTLVRIVKLLPYKEF